MPWTPSADSASRTSSSLKGLMMAVMNFMLVAPVLDLIFLLGCLAAIERGIKNRAGLGKSRKVLKFLGRFRVRRDSLGSGPASEHVFWAKSEKCTEIRQALETQPNFALIAHGKGVGGKAGTGKMTPDHRRRAL